MASTMKYIQVRNYVRSLATHSLKVGDAIPSERELCEQFNVARMTVRQAVDALVVEGILTRVQGRGTFVAQPKIDLQVRLTGFDEEMNRRGMVPSSRLISADLRVPPRDVAAALDLETGQKTFYLYRSRLADGEPMALEEDWVPEVVLPTFFDPTPPPSIYASLVENGLSPQWGEDTVDADEASAEEAKYLGIEPQRAILRIARRTFSSDTAVAFSRCVYRADRYTLWVPVALPSKVMPTPASVIAHEELPTQEGSHHPTPTLTHAVQP